MYISQKSKGMSLMLLYLLLAFQLYWSCVDLNNRFNKLEADIIAQEQELKEIEEELRELEEELDSLNNRLDNLSNTVDTYSLEVYLNEDSSNYIIEDSEEQIEEEIKEGEMELLAQLIEAEAGNQDLIGKILVGDVVMNRCREYDKSLEEVVFAKNQFACIDDGGFDRAGYCISEESFEAAKRAYSGDGLDDEILFFTAGEYNPYCSPAYKYGDHYFGY